QRPRALVDCLWVAPGARGWRVRCGCFSYLGTPSIRERGLANPADYAARDITPSPAASQTRPPWVRPAWRDRGPPVPRPPGPAATPAVGAVRGRGPGCDAAGRPRTELRGDAAEQLAEVARRPAPGDSTPLRRATQLAAVRPSPYRP